MINFATKLIIMTVVKANLINGIVLTVLGLWAALTSSSGTAFIPVAFGVLFLIAHPFMKKENNKIAAHIVVLLTLLAIAGLGMALRGAIGRGETLPIIRVATMLVSCIVAFVVFIKSFIDARKNRV